LVKIAKNLMKANQFPFFEAKLISYFSTIVPLSTKSPMKNWRIPFLSGLKYKKSISYYICLKYSQ
jgi:hypothetical protein